MFWNANSLPIHALFINFHLPESCVDETLFLLTKIDEVKNCWFFVDFRSKITFEPDTPGTWKRGKPAKWIRWDIKRPGVAPCEGHFEIYGRKWQRQLTGFGIGLEKTEFFF